MTDHADNRAARIAELHDAITATSPGHTTTWTDQGIEVTVYGQRRHELHTPTPWAHITIAGKIRAIRTWAQLLDYVDALAASVPSGPDAARSDLSAG